MISVHGFKISPEVEQRAWEAMKQNSRAFTTYKLQVWFENTCRREMQEAAALKRRVSLSDIANRSADRLVTKWKKQGWIVMRRPYWCVLVP